MGCGIDLEANQLLNSLTQGENFVIPTVDPTNPEFVIPGGADGDMYKSVKALTNEDLTTRQVGGSGSFDAIAASLSAHLAAEFKAGRISGAEYTKAYIAMMEAALGGAVQFLLGRDAAYWQSQLAQVQAVTARVQLEVARVQLVEAQLRANNLKAEFALTKAKLATESVDYCVKDYTLKQILPKQKQLIEEQVEVQRSQTSDQRIDGQPVLGLIGTQKDLYRQQITSYRADTKIKASKAWSDSWTVQKTVDEGTLAPNNFTIAGIDDVMTKLKLEVGL